MDALSVGNKEKKSRVVTPIAQRWEIRRVAGRLRRGPEWESDGLPKCVVGRTRSWRHRCILLIDRNFRNMLDKPDKGRSSNRVWPKGVHDNSGGGRIGIIRGAGAFIKLTRKVIRNTLRTRGSPLFTRKEGGEGPTTEAFNRGRTRISKFGILECHAVVVIEDRAQQNRCEEG